MTARPAGGRRCAGAKRRAPALALLAGAMLVSLGLSLGPPAAAASASGEACSALEVSCVAGTVPDTAEEAAPSVDDAADAAEDASHTAVEAANDAEAAIGAVVGGAADVVNGALGPAEQLGDREAAGGGGRGGRDDGAEHGSRGTRRDTHRAGPREQHPRMHARPRRTAASTAESLDGSASAPSSIAGPPSQAVEPGSTTRGAVADIALEIGSRVALPLAILTVIVVVFVATQHRLDRHDPRLRRARLHRDIVKFR
jgi:hypothetical protein